MDTILVVNAGSSSVKFQVFALGSGDGLTRRIKGQIDGIGTKPRLRAGGRDGAALVDRTYGQTEVADVPAALAIVGAWLREHQAIEPIAVGHRVVHGGPDYDRPVVVDDHVIERLERYVSLAPLHQPHNLAPIRTIRARFPQLPQVACFDTGFHRGHSAVAEHFAIPEHFYQEGVRRYGFHGLSYEYVADRLRTVAPDIAAGKVIVAHLGSGASMCALAGGRSVESTMGFTALDGLPMGTRPGQIDPGVLLYLIGEKRMDAAALERLLYQESGLKGLSGISNDMRELQANPDPRAKLAVDYFVHRAALCAGMLAAALGGLDAFVFTAGIGENSSVIRARIVEKLEWLGASIDSAANGTNALRISRPDGRVAVLVVPTDEELMIARHTVALLSQSASV
jgi:acetate kinase